MVHRIEETISRGICIGCGACSVATGGAVKVTLSRHRLYTASLDDATEDQVRVASRVCPFSDEAKTEDELGAPHPGGVVRSDPRTGTFTRTFAGAVTSENARMGSSSGGLTSWLLDRLLDSDLIDGVVHVGRPESGELFEYTLSRSREELADRRKSQYFATTFADVLEEVRRQDLKVAIVGVPCFIKAARLLCDQDPELDARLKYFVGLVCGHLKSQFFSEALAWQVDVPPNELERVDFRLKNADRTAGDYDFGAWRRGEDKPRRRATRTLVGGNWGHGAFQPEACNFCDDIFGETADVVFGDAWLPEYSADWRGTNVVVSRNTEIDRLFHEGQAEGSIFIDDLSVEKVSESQAGNFRHRRDGLAVRLADDIAAGLSVPAKRVDPDVNRVDKARRALIRQRRHMSRLSLETFAEAREANDLSLWLVPMQREIGVYKKLGVSRVRQIRSRLWRVYNSAKKRWGR